MRKRIARRIAALELPGAAAYRARLDSDPAEWDVLDRLCRVTISRFYRDAPEFDRLFEFLGPSHTRAWSMACASGEEPYSLALGWPVRVARRCPGVSLDILASDASPEMVERARAATYPRSIFREMPSDMKAMLGAGAMVTLPASVREAVRFEVIDVRGDWPAGPFDLVLCRNLVFTYFERALQERILERLVHATRPGSLLMIGKREELPQHPAWEPLDRAVALFRRRD